MYLINIYDINILNQLFLMSLATFNTVLISAKTHKVFNSCLRKAILIL